MSGDTSEEKNLPATEHTLRKAREKGQVSSSKDFVTMLVTLGGLFYVIMAWPQFVRVFSDALNISIQGFGQDLEDTYRYTFVVSIVETLRILSPLVAILLLTIFLSNILHKKGIPFSMHPVTPDFNKINPVNGFKKMFGARGMTEFAISLLKVIFWFIVAGILIWTALPSILNSPICEFPCTTAVSNDLLIKLILAAAILLVIGGILDLPLQEALFKREQKMTRTQLKKELKETMGNPEYKGARKEAHREMTQVNTTAGRNAVANLVISGGDVAVALRFNAEDTPVPIVIAKGKGEHGDEIMESSGKLGVPIEHDPELALDLFRTLGTGQQIEERQFQKVALLIIRNGLL